MPFALHLHHLNSIVDRSLYHYDIESTDNKISAMEQAYKVCEDSSFSGKQVCVVYVLSSPIQLASQMISCA